MSWLVAAQGAGRSMIDLIEPLLLILLGGGVTFFIERYKLKTTLAEIAKREAELRESFANQIKDARIERDKAVVARAKAEAAEVEANAARGKAELAESEAKVSQAEAKAAEFRVRELMAQLTSLLVAQNEQRREDAEAVATDLGLVVVEVDAGDEDQVEPVEINPITTQKGSRLLWLIPPLVNEPRFVHFSWLRNTFKIRDYIEGRLLQNRDARLQPEEGFSPESCQADRDTVWTSAKLHLKTRADLYHAVTDFDWWRTRLLEMTRGRDLLHSPRKAEWDKDRIIHALDRTHRRASYGALAGIVGGIAQDVMRGREKTWMNSWVVAGDTRAAPDGAIGSRRGWPTGYPDDVIHRDCLKQIQERREDFTADPYSLMGWLELVNSNGPVEQARMTGSTPPVTVPALQFDDQGHLITPTELEMRLRSAALREAMGRMRAIPDDPPGSDEEFMRAIDGGRPERPLFEGRY